MKTLLFIFTIMIFTLSIQDANAANSIDWTILGYPLNTSSPPFANPYLFEGNIWNGFPLSVVVDATDEGDFNTNGIIDTIDVLVTSTVEPKGVTYTLTETGPNSGIFKGTRFVFLNENYRFLATDIIELSYDADPTFYFCNTDNTITQIDGRNGNLYNGPIVISDSDHVGIGLVLTETGENT